MTSLDLQLGFDGQLLCGDLTRAGADLAVDHSLATAVIISLFTDRRVDTPEVPQDQVSRRGWWGDMLAANVTAPGDQIGSHLWLLRREKQTEETRRRAQEYCAQALAWLLEDKLVVNVSVRTAWIKRGMLGIDIDLQLPDGRDLSYRHQHAVGGA